ncbi:MAG: hypothetical protein Q4A05_10300 [Ruminococcus sp.]|nr:hypothetical protein [Ruminococcus sp.]
MKDEKIFDILENAENEPMDRLIQKCPDISDKQLDRILAESERKYNMKKEENSTDMNMNENDVVEGVERSRRPKWIAPLSMAASVVLIAGVLIGSTALIMKHGRTPDDDDIMNPVAAVSTAETSGTNTGTVTSRVTTSVIPAAEDETDTAAETTAVPETTTEPADDEAYLDISTLAGQWLYQVASDGYSVEESPRNIACLVISEDGCYYHYIDSEQIPYFGKVSVSRDEYYDSSSLLLVEFVYENKVQFSAYYNEDDPHVLSIGSDGTERLVRGTWLAGTGISVIAGKWIWLEKDFNLPDSPYTGNYGTVFIDTDGTYTYTNIDGKVTTGRVETGTEEIGGTTLETVSFYEGEELSFGGYYHFGEEEFISIGNGGISALFRLAD